ncbi:MAG: hypothetical protein JWP29_332 [Rhodoferax sp.]|nr:hypothetical protein [Rhodoferax sp.]
MPIYIRRNAEPFSALATPGDIQILPIAAQSQGSRVLEQEMQRYCAGQVRGRSFLISGHRGSGKTTMVDSAVLRFQQQALDGAVKHKPLPVYLQGRCCSTTTKPRALRTRNPHRRARCR